MLQRPGTFVAKNSACFFLFFFISKTFQMGCEVHDQDFMYKGLAWPPIDRVCGGLLAHVMKIDGSRYPDFYEGLARFAVMEHNRTTKDAHLELVKIRNLNERIDDSVYWCFFRVEAKDKISMVVATYRVVVTYLADKLRELKMFKAEGKNVKEVKSGSNEELMEYIKAMEQRYKEEFQKVKDNQVQMETELSLIRENHAQLQDEFAMMKADIDMRFSEEVACSKSDQIAYRKAADSLDIPPGKKARCE